MDRNKAVQRELEIAAYLDGRLDADDRAAFERTASRDRVTAEELAAAKSALDGREEAPPLPEHIVRKALGLYPAGEKGFDLVLSYLKGVLSVVHASPAVLLQVPAEAGAVRTWGRNKLQLVTMTKRFDRAVIEVYIEGGDRACSFTVRAADADTQTPLFRSRAELFSGDREIASVSLDQEGAALFEQLRPGRYELVVRRNDAVLGSMNVKIRG